MGHRYTQMTAAPPRLAGHRVQLFQPVFIYETDWDKQTRPQYSENKFNKDWRNEVVKTLHILKEFIFFRKKNAA